MAAPTTVRTTVPQLSGVRVKIFSRGSDTGVARVQLTSVELVSLGQPWQLALTAPTTEDGRTPAEPEITCVCNAQFGETKLVLPSEGPSSGEADSPVFVQAVHTRRRGVWKAVAPSQASGMSAIVLPDGWSRDHFAPSAQPRIKLCFQLGADPQDRVLTWEVERVTLDVLHSRTCQMPAI